MIYDFYFSQVNRDSTNDFILEEVLAYAEKNQKQMFLIKSPLSEKKYSFEEYEKVITLLIPGHKIVFINYGTNNEVFEYYIDDFIEDLGSISDKYDYRKIIGRPRDWKKFVIFKYECTKDNFSINQIIQDSILDDPKQKRDSELLLSLLTGSINNVDKYNIDLPDNLLDKVKQNIMLFDGKQTSFIYQKNDKNRIVIQGLSGTGKTELLLHKLKDLYIKDENTKIAFTCYSKVLANNLSKRIPKFFDFMKVQEQIKWNERLRCIGSWGSFNDVNSGIYRYICYFYNIEFLSLKYGDLEKVSEIAVKQITDEMIHEKGYPFDYILIDESQDFPEVFFQLCEKVTSKEVYIAGDIFQSIFDRNIRTDIPTDYLLSKCYRTDPKTLMFAHGLGMGLFEEEKLRWLTDEDWKSCGYIINDNLDKKYIITREPLRRFEDVDEDFKSIELIEIKNSVNDLVDNVLTIIKNLKKEYPTLLPDDIAIMFPNEKNNRLYEMADILKYKIYDLYEWHINKAYETKQMIDNQLFISNKNNVKGLEFPFVICITSQLSKSFGYRNALYMMLTRSFLKTYFITIEGSNDDKMVMIKQSLNEIITTGNMTIDVPTNEEKKKIEEKLINYDIDSNLTQSDVIYKIFYQLNIPEQYRDKICDGIEKRFPEILNEDKLKSIILSDYNLLIDIE